MTDRTIIRSQSMNEYGCAVRSAIQAFNMSDDREGSKQLRLGTLMLSYSSADMNHLDELLFNKCGTCCNL